MVNTKILGLVVTAIVVCVLVVFAVGSLQSPSQVEQQQALDFTVTGKNDCLRFLNSTVSTCYVPFRTAANEHWQLTINATQMPGGANGWTDVYVYKGYWNGGADYKCVSQDVYPILSSIQSAGAQVTGNSPFTETFGGANPQSYTVFFIFPPGGQATFHVTLERV